MTGEYEEKKAAYENLAAGLESNMSKLEQVIPTHTLPYTFKDEPFLLHSCKRTHVRIAMAAQDVIFAPRSSALSLTASVSF